MRRRWPLAFTAACVLACRAPRAPSASPPPIALELLEVCGDEGDLRLSFPAANHPASLFSFFGPDGRYRGTVRATPSGVDCDDCEGPEASGVLVDGRRPRWKEHCLVAVGPVPAPLQQARLTLAEPRYEKEWAPLAALDRDGDGAIDLEWMKRCGHTTPSGCNDQVCDQTCLGVRAAGTGAPTTVRCRAFVPDLQDCKPD